MFTNEKMWSEDIYKIMLSSKSVGKTTSSNHQRNVKGVNIYIKRTFSMFCSHCIEIYYILYTNVAQGILQSTWSYI